MLSPVASGTVGCPRRRPLTAILTTIVAFLVVGAATLPAAAQVVPYVTAREKGVLSEHGVVSFAPWEAIDPWSGNAMLSFVDVDLVGNAGFNLTVRRIYNSKGGGSWVFDIGMPSLRFAYGDHPDYPIVINGDGSTTWLAQSTFSGDIYLSTSFWRYNASSGVLQSPAGITYTFDALGHPVSATDPFGNQQLVTWVNGRIDHIVQTLNTQQSREIDFAYDGQGNVSSLSCQGKVWQYTWAAGQLTQATSPAGPAWTISYSRTTVGTEDQSSITVTSPTGGWVQYVSRKHLDPSPIGGDPRWDSFTVRTRQAGGMGVTAGTWQFTYPSDGTPKTTIEGSGGTTYHAEYTFINNGTFWTVPLGALILGSGTAQQQTNYAWEYGVLLGSTYWAYVNGQLVPFGPTRALLPVSAAVTQSGRTYTRSYQYNESDTTHFNNFGQPTNISTTGDFSSSTSLEYLPFSGTTYLRNMPGSIEVDGVTGSAQYNDTGFVSRSIVRDKATMFTPDTHGNVAQKTKEIPLAGTQSTTFTYDWGVASSVTVDNPASTVVRTINPDGSVATETENGHLTTYTYDAAGRLTGLQPPVGNPYAITYAADGSWVKRARGTAWTTVCVDGLGRTAFTFDSAGARTDVEYDAVGRLVRQSLPYTTTPPPSSCSSPAASAPPSTSLEYDALGRVTAQTNPNNTVVSYAFDATAIGLRTTITDELNRATVQVLQASGTPSNTRVKSVTNADNKTTIYSYDDAGQLTQVLGPNGLAKSWTYGSQGRMLTETQPESGTVSYNYNALGNVLTRTDALSHKIIYSRDLNQRVIGMTTDPATSYSATFAYDASGNRIMASNGYVSTQFTYDDGNRLTARLDTIAGHQFVTRVGYDDNDNVIDVWYPSGNHVSYDPDGNNRLIRVHDDSRGLEFANSFIYRPSGAIASYTSGNGIVNTVDYNANTEQPTHIGSSGGVMDITYTYDGAGNVTGIADPRLGMTATYGYDVLSRLHTAQGLWGTLTYVYDSIGNRTSSTLVDTMTPPTTTTTTSDYSPTTNRLLSTTRGLQQYEGFLHDDDGRLTQDGRIQTYTYTPQDLVETATTWSGALNTYRYDVDGQRVLKIAGSETSRTYVVNELSEFSTEGGPIHWTVDYVSAGSRLLAAVRPVTGTLYTLTATKAGTGTGRVSAVPAGLDCGPDCSARYLSGSTVTLTGVPDTASYFTGWGGACSGTAVTVTVTIDAAKSCTATFVMTTYTLTMQKTGSGSAGSTVTSTPGGITCGATCAASFAAGTSVQLTAVAAWGFQLVRWDGTGCTTGTVTMSGARTCTAVFQALPCDPDGSLYRNCQTLGGTWNSATCSCSHFNQDPLLLALDGGALDLTDLAHGVRFDTDGDGVTEQIAWTTAGSRVGLLALDLNGNGVIETGAELFAGPPSGPIRGRAPTDLENSFTLLAVYDDPAQGGNGDGAISAEDAVFSRLRFWIDTNHDGISQPEELVSLAAAGVVSIELTYQATGRRDGLGNYYRYRGIVHLTSGRHVPIWDVFLATEAPSGGQCPAAGGASEAAGGAARQQGDSVSDWADAIEEDGPRVDEGGEAVVLSASPALDGGATSLQVVEYYHLDAIGSVRAVTDQDGQVTRRHDFLPFGEELLPQIPPIDRRLFTGQERDVETALDYFHARQLRVDLGRFTTTDPMTDLAWTDPVLGASNAYGYVGGNPLGFTDPSGACWICELFHVAHQAWDALTGSTNTGPVYTNEPQAMFRSGVVVTVPKDAGPVHSSVTQTLTPMGAGALSFFPGRAPVGQGVGGGQRDAAQSNLSNPSTQELTPEQKKACHDLGVVTAWTGAAAAVTTVAAIALAVAPTGVSQAAALPTAFTGGLLTLTASAGGVIYAHYCQ